MKTNEAEIINAESVTIPFVLVLVVGAEVVGGCGVGAHPITIIL